MFQVARDPTSAPSTIRLPLLRHLASYNSLVIRYCSLFPLNYGLNIASAMDDRVVCHPGWPLGARAMQVTLWSYHYFVVHLNLLWFICTCDRFRFCQSMAKHRYSTRIVHTKYGPLQGIIVQNLQVEAFLGVPYATPPLESLRFMPPVVPSLWTNIRMADAFSPVCPQKLPDISNRTEALLQIPRGRLVYLEKLLPLLANQSEDCLYLNIYVPKTTSKCFFFYLVFITCLLYSVAVFVFCW